PLSTISFPRQTPDSRSGRGDSHFRSRESVGVGCDPSGWLLTADWPPVSERGSPACGARAPGSEAGVGWSQSFVAQAVERRRSAPALTTEVPAGMIEGAGAPRPNQGSRALGGE